MNKTLHFPCSRNHVGLGSETQWGRRGQGFGVNRGEDLKSKRGFFFFFILLEKSNLENTTEKVEEGDGETEDWCLSLLGGRVWWSACVGDPATRKQVRREEKWEGGKGQF